MEEVTCCAAGCESTPNQNVTFFRLPVDQERCCSWLNSIGRTDLTELAVEYLYENYFVCSLHFDDNYLQGAIIEEDTKVEGLPVDVELEETGEDDSENFVLDDENSKVIYLDGVGFVNVKTENTVDVQEEGQIESDDKLVFYVVNDNETASAISNQGSNKVVLIKQNDSLVPVFESQLSNQDNYQLVTEKIKVEKPDEEVPLDDDFSINGDDDDYDDGSITRTFLCHTCGKAFMDSDSLKGHLSVEHGGQPKIENDTNIFKCDFCSMEFTMFDQMKTHIRRIHMQPRSYTCEVCNAVFSHRSNLSRHKQQHCSSKKFQCDQCGKGFSQKSNLTAHQATVHINDLQITAAVDVITRPGAERIHRKPKIHRCAVCDKSFVSLTGLKNHGALHTGVRPYICGVCNKSFTLMSCLKTHMSTIHSDKKHYCELCGKCYQSEHYLKTHLRIHSGAKDFKCEHCSKCFIDQPSLKLHMRTHTGEKPFGCSICNRTFTQQSHLKTHKRIHTGEKPYNCQTCGKAFRQLSNVLEHSRTHKK